MRNFSIVKSAAVLGVDAYIVDVECHLSSAQIPRFITVGLPEGAVKESKERVTSALKNNGYFLPNKKIVINLAPADIRKEGSSYDLPIAIGILAAADEISGDKLDEYVLLGELALDGTLRAIKGALPISVSVAKQGGIKGIILPVENAKEAAIIGALDIIGVDNLEEAILFLNGDTTIAPIKVDLKDIFKENSQYAYDFSDVKGQENVKRALEVAAAGGHNIIMIGPPGSGKTMLAKRFATILPDMTLAEALETTKIHSVAGQVPPGQGIIAIRPFRSPHHTISDAALVGGGKVPRPGEVSLSHHGVLFLDELPEFKKNVLEVMRQPLENGMVTISRAQMSLTYPSKFMLVAAMNPCPCGYATDPKNECSCAPAQIQRYMAKISGPLLDRIDIHIEVPAVEFDDLARKESGEASLIVRQRVQKAREIQTGRFKNEPAVFCNSHMESDLLHQYCGINKVGENLLKTAISKLGLSARAYDRILKVSRTIADLANSETIRSEHLAEAIQYRSLDRQLWM